MKADIVFTPAQQKLINHIGTLFVEACPGAGKTQSIIERFKVRSRSLTRQGIALLSFTNAAVNEARQRCAQDPQLLLSPNYVGTIDSFINKFVVGPVYRFQSGKPVTFKDSWETVQGTTFRVPLVRTLEFQLAWFTFSAATGSGLQIQRIPGDIRHLYRQLTEPQRRAAASRAAELFELYTGNGIHDSAAARSLMHSFLDEPKFASTVGKSLKARFCEAIVDEVQDCSDSDISLIEFLLDSGIDVVMVGDLEQAIYEFRGSSVESVRALIKRVPNGARLDGNFRSSPEVCSLVNSIRYGPWVDLPARIWERDLPSVHIVPVAAFSGVHRTISALARKHGIADEEVVVLAHREDDARRCAGVSRKPATSGNRLVNLARSARAVQDPGTSSRTRRRELQRFGALIRDLTPSDLHTLSDDQFFERIGIPPRAFHDGCLRLIFRVDPAQVSPSDYGSELKKGARALGWDKWVDFGKLRAPMGDEWPDEWSDVGESLRWSTIHSFKGLQAPAVAVAMPSQGGNPNSPLNCWLRDEPEESRRVLYVAASRAEILAILVVHEDDCENVVSCLNRDGVNYVRVEPLK